jgi:hypothetical protein
MTCSETLPHSEGANAGRGGADSVARLRFATTVGAMVGASHPAPDGAERKRPQESNTGRPWAWAGTTSEAEPSECWAP